MRSARSTVPASGISPSSWASYWVTSICTRPWVAAGVKAPWRPAPRLQNSEAKPWHAEPRKKRKRHAKPSSMRRCVFLPSKVWPMPRSPISPREAGVTRGAIYWHFANKADLINTLWEQVQSFYAPLTQASERIDEPDPLGKLQELYCSFCRHGGGSHAATDVSHPL